jgi:FkbM family methyltransferase
MKNLVCEINGIYWPKQCLETINNHYNTSNGILSAITPFLKGKKTLVQAGGHCGLVIKQFVDVFENIYTFEPDPLNFFCLNLNLPYSNVVKIQSCLGDEHKLVGLINDVSESDSGATHVTLEKKETDKIPMLKIDDLNLNSCNLICLDTEGYEFNILSGAKETLKKFRPVLCLEEFAAWRERYSVSSEKFDNLMNEIQYKRVSEFRTHFSVDGIYAPIELNV